MLLNEHSFPFAGIVGGFSMRTIFLTFLCSYLTLVLSCAAVSANKTATPSASPVPKEHHLVTQTSDTPSAFDDMIEALKWRDSQCVLHQSGFDRTAIVRDYFSGEKIPVKEAIYVKGSDITTPAGGDVISLLKREDAERFVNIHGGTIVTYDYLTSLTFE